MTKQERIKLQDTLRRAKDFAFKLAKDNGYEYSAWLQGQAGLCRAGFEREGERWSLPPFFWTPAEGTEMLQKKIEGFNHMMRIAMSNFEVMKFGAQMKDAGVNVRNVGRA